MMLPTPSDLYALYLAGEDYNDIARYFSVRRGTVFAAICGHRRKHGIDPQAEIRVERSKSGPMPRSFFLPRLHAAALEMQGNGQRVTAPALAAVLECDPSQVRANMRVLMNRGHVMRRREGKVFEYVILHQADGRPLPTIPKHLACQGGHTNRQAQGPSE